MKIKSEGKKCHYNCTRAAFFTWQLHQFPSILRCSRDPWYAFSHKNYQLEIRQSVINAWQKPIVVTFFFFVSTLKYFLLWQTLTQANYLFFDITGMYFWCPWQNKIWKKEQYWMIQLCPRVSRSNRWLALRKKERNNGQYQLFPSIRSH